ncbi:MAG: two-component system, NtrC family, response regulator AtoC, partial [Acidobacteriaceae bacterium]|nr:two-component system, NtrC family, response regulator AtoC [Acidobacteriaceae bacterium]
MARVLIVEDESNMRKVLSANLRQDGHVLVEAATVKEGLQAVHGNGFEVVLLDQKLPDGEGSEVLKAVQQSEPSTAVVVLTAYGTVELAVEAMRSGAFDFLTKPFSSDNLRAVVHRAADWASLQRENHLLRDTVDRLEGQSEIRGSSVTVAKLRELISRVGPTEA